MHVLVGGREAERLGAACDGRSGRRPLGTHAARGREDANEWEGLRGRRPRGRRLPVQPVMKIEGRTRARPAAAADGRAHGERDVKVRARPRGRVGRTPEVCEQLKAVGVSVSAAVAARARVSAAVAAPPAAAWDGQAERVARRGEEAAGCCGDALA